MEKGEIFLHRDFKFANGGSKQKFLVLLYAPARKDQPYLFCLTTSQEKKKSFKEGCQPNRSLFFIPKNKEYFNENTWLQLFSIYPIEAHSVVQDSLLGYMERKDKLQELTIRQLMNCIKKSKDVEENYQKLILEKK